MPCYVVNVGECSIYTWKECIFCAFFFWYNVLKIAVKFNYSVVSFKISLALLICFLEGMSIDVSEVLNCLTIIFPRIFPFMSVHICCMYLDAPILGAYTLMSIISSCWVDPFIFSVLFIFLYGLCFKVYFFWYKHYDTAFLSFLFAWKIFFHPFTSTLCVPGPKVDLF